jgi:hypothetical protein
VNNHALAEMHSIRVHDLDLPTNPKILPSRCELMA